MYELAIFTIHILKIYIEVFQNSIYAGLINTTLKNGCIILFGHIAYNFKNLQSPNTRNHGDAAREIRDELRDVRLQVVQSEYFLPGVRCRD